LILLKTRDYCPDFKDDEVPTNPEMVPPETVFMTVQAALILNRGIFNPLMF